MTEYLSSVTTAINLASKLRELGKEDKQKLLELYSIKDENEE